MDVEELVGIEPESAETEHTIYELFKWSVLLKGAISLAEVVVGILLLVLPRAWVTAAVEFSVGILSDYATFPFVQSLLDEILHYGSSAILFAAFFLLSRGLIKCVLIWALLKSILWAYPWSLVVMGLFVIYQIYEIIHTGSMLIIGITIFDLVVMYFIWREWRIVIRHRASW